MLLNFKDPASVYAYSLMFVHHQVMWYMILILAVVYWSFYRIIREYNWNSFNRHQGITFLWTFYDLRFFEAELSTTPHWYYLTASWNYLLVRISRYLLGQWLAKKNSFSGYQSWGRLATTMHTLLNAHRLETSRVLPHAELLRDKYFTLSSRSHWSPAYLMSSSTTSSKEVLAVQAFRENLMLEYLWAIFPSLVIFLILIPSLYLLYSLEERIDPKFHLKVIGHQWFWTYEFDVYDLEFNFQYDSNLILEADLPLGAKRLLEVDRRLYLPVNVPLRFLITSSDVLHSWAVPELGIKVDAVPGRLNDALTLIRRPGVFYGQCSELCGVGHGFMPIVVEAVSYRQWIALLRELS